MVLCRSLSSINYHTKIIRKSNSTKVAVPNESIKNYVNGDIKTKSYSDIETNDSSVKDDNLKDRCASNNCKAETFSGNNEKAKISTTNGHIASFFIKRNIKKDTVSNEEIAETLDKESQSESNSALALKSNFSFEQEAENVKKQKKTAYLPKKTLKNVSILLHLDGLVR